MKNSRISRRETRGKTENSGRCRAAGSPEKVKNGLAWRFLFFMTESGIVRHFSFLPFFASERRDRKGVSRKYI